MNWSEAAAEISRRWGPIVRLPPDDQHSDDDELAFWAAVEELVTSPTGGKFDPRQRRDSHGRWTDEGGGLLEIPESRLGHQARVAVPATSKWPKEIHEEIARTIDEAVARYPILQSRGPRPLVQVLHTSGADAQKIRRLLPRGVICANVNAIDKSYNILTLNDFYPPVWPVRDNPEIFGDGGIVRANGDSPRGTIWHEVGHALLYANGTDTVGYSEERNQQAIRNYMEDYGIVFADVALLSRYASSSPKEAFGELSAVYHVSPEELSPELRHKAKRMFDDLAAGKGIL